jgi:hypothetical protein
MSSLILKRAAASRPTGQWNDDGFDVLADGTVVGRIFKANAAPVGSPWMWTLAFGHHEDRTPTHGYEATREAAMAALGKGWRREWKAWTGLAGGSIQNVSAGLSESMGCTGKPTFATALTRKGFPAHWQTVIAERYFHGTTTIDLPLRTGVITADAPLRTVAKNADGSGWAVAWH